MFLPRPVLGLAAAALVGGGAGAVATEAFQHDTPAATSSVITATRPVASTSSSVLSPHQVYENAKDSVAYITSQITQQTNSPFGSEQSGTATGSGFVVSSDGYIVTNAHVVDGASKVSVKVGDGKTQTARVVGKDDSTDLALLKVDASGLKPLTLGDSSSVQVGDPAYAIGNPFGLDRTLTTGVISALQRQISSPNGFSIDDVLQTDAAINPGNSGGPLFDGQGNVIGVNSQIESASSSQSGEAGNVGIGFAIPSDTVKNVISQLMKSGKVSHAYLGVSTTDGSGAGAQVASVPSGGPAADAGLKAGDVITGLGGKTVEDSSSLSGLVDARKAGETVSVTVRRNGQDKTLQVKLGERPATTDTTSQQNFGGNGSGSGDAPTP